MVLSSISNLLLWVYIIDKVLPEARIIGVADVVEAISSRRPYRTALGIDKALKEISKNRGILYDPEVVDICLRLFKEKDLNLNERFSNKYLNVFKIK